MDIQSIFTIISLGAALAAIVAIFLYSVFGLLVSYRIFSSNMTLTKYTWILLPVSILTLIFIIIAFVFMIQSSTTIIPAPSVIYPADPETTLVMGERRTVRAPVVPADPETTFVMGERRAIRTRTRPI